MKTHDDEQQDELGQEDQDGDPPDDPRWEALAMGTLSDEEAEALRLEASETEEGRRKYELFRPFDEKETDAALARLLATRLDSASDVTPSDVAAAKGATHLPAPRIPANDSPSGAARPWASRRSAIVAAFAFAAAAALALVLTRPDAPPKMAALPPFDLTTNGGEKAVRSVPTGPSTSLLLTRPETHGRVTLTPSRAYDDNPSAKTLLLQNGKLVKARACKTKVSLEQIEIDCVREDLVSGSPPGTWTLLIALSPPAEMPKDDAELVNAKEPAAGEAGTQRVQIYRVPIDFNGTQGALPPSLHVEMAGCAQVRSAGDQVLCEIPKNRKITVWIKAPSGAVVTRTLGGKALGSPGKALQGGERFVVENIPDDAGSLVVEAAQYGITSTSSLTLAPHTPNDALDRAEVLRRDPKTCPDAKGLLTPLLTDPDPVVRALATGKLARVERQLGNLGAAAGHFGDALTLDAAAGLISAEADDRLAFSFALSENSPERKPRFQEARRVLEEMAPLLTRYPEGRALRPYYLGVIEVNTGDLRAALRSFDAAEQATERLGLDAERSETRREIANVLSMLGRRAEALAIFQDIERSRVFGADTCAEEQFFNSFGWFALSSAEVEGGATPGMPAPIPLLEASLDRFRRHCPESSDIQHVLLNLATAEVDRGDLGRARAYLDQGRKEDPHPDARADVGWIKLEARIAFLNRQYPEALKESERLAALARQAGLPIYSAQAALGRAQALDALDRPEDARKAYAEAESFLDARALAVPIGEGKEGFLARQEQSTRLHLDFLVRRAEGALPPETALEYLTEAATVARKSRARILTSLQSIDRLDGLSTEKRAAFREAMDAYRSERAVFDAAKGTAKDSRAIEAKLDAALALAGVPSGTEAPPLPGPAPGEVILVYHPVQGGWVGLSITERGIHPHRLGALDLHASKDRLSQQLLSPFESDLAGATRVRFAPYGPLAKVDFHALPWKGKTLLASAAVVYGVDLPQSHREPRRAGGLQLALVVDDPDGDLPLARDEASDVASAFRAMGIQVNHLSDHQATYEAVLPALSLVDLFHYSGHGHFAEQNDGLGSGLGLSARRRLTAGDILALPRAPRQVILSGCETARTAESALPQGLGLGQAFVAAGAESVVASTRVVDDALARRMMSLLAQRSGKGTGDLATALRDVQLEEANASPASDWPTFRLLVP